MTEAQQQEIYRLRTLADGGTVRHDVPNNGACIAIYRIGGRTRRKMIFEDGSTHSLQSERKPDPRCPYCAGKGYCYPAGIKTLCTCVPR